MSTSQSRRTFSQSALAAGALAGLGDFTFLLGLPAVDGTASPRTVQLDPDIEPLVRMIEETSRDKLLEATVNQIRAGVSYQKLLSAAFLAGVRNIQPRPVGFEFHCVMAIHSAHQAAQAAADADRWLALFWALDNFKESQAIKQKKGAWTMPALEESKLPRADQARKAFASAMDAWDIDGADRAVAALARSCGANEVFELLASYCARDFRAIGHKAIYVANGCRTLNTIGWRHAEPVLRSIAFALLAYDGTNPAKSDHDADRPGRENQERAAKLRTGWQHGKVTPDAAGEQLAAERTGSYVEACDQAVELLNREVDPASIWDGIFLSAGELLMRAPGIVALHCVTSANALHYAFQTSGNEGTRKMMLLQAAAFAALFRKAVGRRESDRNQLRIDQLEKADGATSVEEIFANVSKDRPKAASKALALLAGEGGGAEALLSAGRRLVFNKGRDSHDYKFSSAAMEDYRNVTPHWRDRYLASSLFWLHGSGDPDNNLMQRARAALA